MAITTPAPATTYMSTMPAGHSYVDHVGHMLGSEIDAPTQGKFGGYAYLSPTHIIARSPISGLRPVIEQAIAQVKKANPTLTGDALESKIAQTLTGYNDWANLTEETQAELQILTGINFDAMTEAQRESTINHLLHSPIPFGDLKDVLTPSTKIELGYTHTLDKDKTMVEKLADGNWKITMISNNNNGSHTGHSLGSFIVKLGANADAGIAKQVGNQMVTNTNDNTKLYLDQAARDVLYGTTESLDMTKQNVIKMEAGHNFHDHMSHMYSNLMVDTQKEYGGHTFLNDKYIVARSPISAMQPAIEQAIKNVKAAQPNLSGQELESKIAQTLTGYNDWADLNEATQAEIMILTGVNFDSMSEAEREKTFNHLIHSPMSFGDITKVLTKDVKIDLGYTHTLDETKTIVEAAGDGIWKITVISNNNNGSHTGHNMGSFLLNVGGETDVSKIKAFANDMLVYENNNAKLFLDQAGRDILYGNVEQHDFTVGGRYTGGHDQGHAHDPKPYTLTGDNLVQNGGFEASGKPANGFHQQLNNVAGWRNVGDNFVEIQTRDFDTTGKSGNVMEVDVNGGRDEIYQDMTTEAGKKYELKFEAALRPENIASAFEVMWNGKVIAQINPSYKTFSTYVYEVVGTGGSDRLAFRELANENNAIGAVIDNVSVIKYADAPVVPPVTPPTDGTINGTAGNDMMDGTDGKDTMLGGDGNDVMYGGKGDDVLDGQGGDYNQADFAGFAKDYKVVRNADGSFTFTSAAFGTDTLKNIDGVWFYDEAKWYALEDLAAAVTPPVVTPPGGHDGNHITGTAADEGLEGTDSADHIKGGGGNDVMYGGKGNDYLDGETGDYNQVDYNGSAKDYTFKANADGTVTVTSAAYGTDTLANIDGIWFYDEAKWYSLEELSGAAKPPVVTPPAGSGGTDGNDTFVGTDGNDGYEGGAGDDVMSGGKGDDTFVGGTGNDKINGGEGYDQVDYSGKAADYHFTANADGTISVQHAMYGTDVLKDIDGLWFGDEGQWYDPAALAAAHAH